MRHLAVDVGGTFTDICLFDDEEESTRVGKVSSTRDPIDAVFEGIEDIGVNLNEIGLFSHGTTVATNALITRSFPRAFTRPSAGGGGYGDPLLRDAEAVKEDVADGYVTPEGARRDYGVVVREVDAELAEWDVDKDATEEERRTIRGNRAGWVEADPEELAQRYRDGKVGTLELIRRYGVILDWGTGELLPKTTEGFRTMLKRRVVPHWENGAPKD
jgi:hypothetical protein